MDYRIQMNALKNMLNKTGGAGSKIPNGLGTLAGVLGGNCWLKMSSSFCEIWTTLTHHTSSWRFRELFCIQQLVQRGNVSLVFVSIVPHHWIQWILQEGGHRVVMFNRISGVSDQVCIHNMHDTEVSMRYNRIRFCRKEHTFASRGLTFRTILTFAHGPRRCARPQVRAIGLWVGWWLCVCVTDICMVFVTPPACHTGTRDLQMVDLTLRVLYKPSVAALPLILQTLGEDYDERGTLALVVSFCFQHLWRVSDAVDHQRNTEERYCAG
jgi:hypothetical protein